jgi:hypothetical protein
MKKNQTFRWNIFPLEREKELKIVPSRSCFFKSVFDNNKDAFG